VAKEQESYGGIETIFCYLGSLEQGLGTGDCYKRPGSRRHAPISRSILSM